MAGHLQLASGSAVLALVVSLLAAGGSTAEQFPSLARTAKVGTGCKLTAAAPTEASDQITGKGSIRCNASRTVHYFIATQISEQGRWSGFGSFDDEGFRVRAGRTRHVTTRPANCKGLGQVKVRTLLRLGRAGGSGPHTTSPIVEIACSEHRRP
jgi:hypothetical protein